MSAQPEIPLLDLTEQYASIKDEIDVAVQRVLDSQHFVLGPEVEAFEKEIARAIDAPYAVGCASGSDALLLSLKILGIGRGDQVLCPSYSFFATAGSIWHCGAEPVFVDIEPVTYGLDPTDLARKLARCRNPRAIVPVHLFGQACELGAIERIAEGHGLPLVVDAAQSLGCRDSEGRPIGQAGDFACVSFFPSKNLGGLGDGGLVALRDPEHAQRLRELRVHGAAAEGLHHAVGLNSRLDALQAAALAVKLRHLPHWEAARRRNADDYDALFHAAGAQDSSKPLAKSGFPLRTPARRTAPARHVFNQYVVRVPAELRDRLRAHLAANGIGTAVYYPTPLHLQPCFASLGSVKTGSLPVSESAARETLALPVFAELGAERVRRVANSVCEFLDR